MSGVDQSGKLGQLSRWPDIFQVVELVEVERDKLVPGVLLDIISTVALDLAGPDSLDNDGPKRSMLEIRRVNGVVDGERSALTRVRCEAWGAEALMRGVGSGGWRELAETLFTEEIVFEYGELWRSEATAGAAEFIDGRLDVIKSVIRALGSGEGGYFYESGIINELDGFPTAACLL